MAQATEEASGPPGLTSPRRAKTRPPSPRQAKQPPKKPKEPTLKPNPADPLDVLKFELAEEMGLLEKVRREGWGGLSAAETGRLGGMMTRRRVERGELIPGQPAPPRNPPPPVGTRPATGTPAQAPQAGAPAEAGADAEQAAQPEEAGRSPSKKGTQRGTV